jgi:hypothetical protein
MNSRNCLITLFVCLGAALGAHAQTINVVSLGVHPDGTNGTVNTKILENIFYAYPNGKIIFPGGVYAIDNTQGAVYIPNFSGELEFQGDAQLMFQTPAQGGLRFQGGSGARIKGLHGNFATQPTERGNDEFSFTSMNDLTVEDAIAQNSPGMGFLFTLCVRPKVSNITVSYSLADGLAFANSQNAQLTNYTSEYTTDNGLAFYNYAGLTDLDGGNATNIHITQDIGAHGIAIVGTSNVVVSDFTVDTTAGSGVWVSQDPAYGTRTSTNVVVQHGLIMNAGTIPQTPPANEYGIEYDTVDNVLFSDIRIVGSGGRGVSGESPTGTIRFHNVRVLNNLSGDAFVIGQTALVEMADCVSENSPNNGFSFNQVNTLIARDLKVMDSSSQNSLNRAIWFENGNSVIATGLAVIDDRTTPAGYIIGASDSSLGIQKGTIQGITSAISNGSLVTNAYSPGITWSNVH